MIPALEHRARADRVIPEFLGPNGPDADMMPTGLPQRWA